MDATRNKAPKNAVRIILEFRTQLSKLPYGTFRGTEKCLKHLSALP